MQENRAWNRLKEEELIETLKLMEASEIYPAKAQKVYEALKINMMPKIYHLSVLWPELRNLLGKSDEELDEITDENGIGIVDKGKYNLGFKKAKKKGTYIIGYWYDEKDGEEGAHQNISRDFCSDAVILFQMSLIPEYKPEYYSSLQRLFGTGQVKELNEFSRKIVDLKPYSAEGGIDVMENILIVQKAIDMQKRLNLNLAFIDIQVMEQLS